MMRSILTCLLLMTACASSSQTILNGGTSNVEQCDISDECCEVDGDRWCCFDDGKKIRC